MSGISFKDWQDIKKRYQFSVRKAGIDITAPVKIPRPLSFVKTLNLKNSQEHYFDLDYNLGGMHYE